MAKSDLTAERLRELLHYDPETGVFTWLVGWGRRTPGAIAGSLHYANRAKTYARLRICVDGGRYYAHQLAWLYMTGEWSAQEIDHRKNGPLDNRWSNLRDVGRGVNAQNLRSARRDNKTGFLGVSWSKAAKKFVAQIQSPGRSVKYLGLFDTAEEAHSAYLLAKRELHIGCTI